MKPAVYTRSEISDYYASLTEKIVGYRPDIINFPRWNIISPDGKYELHVFLLEGDILLLKDKGHLTTEYALEAANIFRDVISYSEIKQLYFLADLSELKSMPRRARKILKEADDNLKHHWKHYFFIYSPVIRIIYRIFNAFSPTSLKNSTIVDSLEEGIKQCFEHRRGSLHDEKTVEPEDISSREELLQLTREELVDKLLQERERRDREQQRENENLDKVFRAISRISWDDNFTPIPLQATSNTDPFKPLFYAVSILQEDIYDILNEMKELNRNLEQKVQERTKEIYRNEANLSSLIENTTDLIFSIDSSYRLIAANTAYKDYVMKYFGCHIGTGISMDEALPQEVVDYWKPLYIKAFDGHSFKHEAIRHIDGNELVLESSFNPIREMNGSISGVSIFVKDVTEQRQYAHRLKEQNAQLKKVNSELDRFVYSASHDLRAPLLSLLGLINLAKTDVNTMETVHYLDMMEQSVTKLDKFIKEIIDYSRNSRLHLSRNEIWFESLIHEIISSVQFAEHTPVQHEVTVSQQVPFFCDLNRLKVILSNIIYNGIHYCDPEKQRPYLKVEIVATEEKCRITIRDNGVGIAEEHINKIFDMFYRADERTTGSGLGLYIVKETLEKLGGQIMVTSEIKKGTSFQLEIPRVDATQ